MRPADTQTALTAVLKPVDDVPGSQEGAYSSESHGCDVTAVAPPL